ncbi:MAG TPA: serine protease, partial [Verrucomicrobiae bacterium]|nr:serine protease [Verrucomicrobiae bacterium]
ALVDRINGIRIEKLEDVIRAFEQDTGKEQHLIQFYPDGTMEAISKQAAASTHTDILKTYGVPKDRRL